ncbi:MAG: hypothetical protein ACLFS3_02370 [Candidatus Aenigmatarchaeota archaeon]
MNENKDISGNWRHTCLNCYREVELNPALEKDKRKCPECGEEGPFSKNIKYHDQF